MVWPVNGRPTAPCATPGMLAMPRRAMRRCQRCGDGPLPAHRRSRQGPDSALVVQTCGGEGGVNATPGGKTSRWDSLKRGKDAPSAQGAPSESGATRVRREALRDEADSYRPSGKFLPPVRTAMKGMPVVKRPPTGRPQMLSRLNVPKRVRARLCSFVGQPVFSGACGVQRWACGRGCRRGSAQANAADRIHVRRALAPAGRQAGWTHHPS